MKTIRTVLGLKQALRAYRDDGKSVGYVPTMGALHAGHLALIRRSRAENDITLVSVFINPLQFGPREDFRRYPRKPARDIRLLKKARVDLCFAPEAQALFRSKAMARRRAPHELTRTLCGPLRPGHFDGVVTIVSLFFHLIRPTRAYFGQKDYQQYRVIEAMTRQEFGDAIEVRLVPTVRGAGGLALSSRNQYLSDGEAREARKIYQTLRLGQTLIRSDMRPLSKILGRMRSRLEASSLLSVEYVDIVDSQSLRKVVKLTPESARKVLLALAVRTPKARLIDNLLVHI